MCVCDLCAAIDIWASRWNGDFTTWGRWSSWSLSIATRQWLVFFKASNQLLPASPSSSSSKNNSRIQQDLSPGACGVCMQGQTVVVCRKGISECATSTGHANWSKCIWLRGYHLSWPWLSQLFESSQPAAAARIHYTTLGSLAWRTWTIKFVVGIPIYGD